MKKFLFFIMFFLVCLASFGQRRNDEGLKMIKKATFTWMIYSNNSSDSYGWKTYYDFVYDKNNKLNTFTIKKDYYSDYVFKEQLSKAEYKKNGISSTNCGTFQYMKLEFDENDHIRHIWDYDKTSDGCHTGFYYTMKYDVKSRPITASLKGFSADKKNKINYGMESTNRGKYYNDIVMMEGWTEDRCKKETTKFDFSKPNDINVNLINGLVKNEKLCVINLDMTEWMNFRSDYLVKEGGDNNLTYYYDGNGNIVKATWQEKHGAQYWKCELTIDYLE